MKGNLLGLALVYNSQVVVVVVGYRSSSRSHGLLGSRITTGCTVGDGRLRPSAATLANSTKHTHHLWFSPIRCIM